MNKKNQAALTEAAARAAHEVNKMWCEAHGDFSQSRWEDASEHQRRSCIAGVEAIEQNPGTTPEMSHEVWMALKLAEGWTFGAVKGEDTKTHPCLVPYDQLPPEQRFKDRLFCTVVRAVLSSRAKS